MAAASAGHWAEGLARIERAIELAPERADYHAQRARFLALLRRDAEAAAATERALALEPRDALTLDTLGVVLARIGAHARATDVFRRATALAPRRADFHYNLGASLRFVGDFDGAERAFEQAVSLEPTLYRAHSALADLRTQRPGCHHIERLTALLENVGDDVDGELRLRHALAKELDDLGEHAAAFANLEAGKARKRAAVGYRFATDRELFEALEAVFDESSMQGRGQGYANNEPIFVLGMPRTGTTLVERILSSHSQVRSAGELGNFAVCLKHAAGTRSPRVLDRETIAAAARADFRALGERYIESTRLITGTKRHFVDKMPLNFFLVGFIALALPSAKIVCVRRGAMDTCLANYRQLFSADFRYYQYAYDLTDTARYYACFVRLMRRWRRLLGERFFELRYERLVAYPRRETGRLCEHVGLDFEAGCLEFHRNPEPVATASAVQVRQPLHAKSIGRWHRYKRELEPLRVALEAEGIALEGDDA
jgi:Tfp pilus assembly protein PilF